MSKSKCVRAHTPGRMCSKCGHFEVIQQTDDRRIKERDASRLTIEDLRALVTYCDWHHEGLWRPYEGDLSAQQILNLYHAAADAGYVSLQGWYEEDRKVAETRYEKEVNK